LAEKYSWHLGFAAAGTGMMLGLAIYLLGRPTFPPEPLHKKGDHLERPALTPRDWRTIAILVGLLPVLAVSVLSNQQIQNAYLVWGKSSFQRVFFGHTMPISWLISMDASISAVLMVGVIAFWRWWGRRWTEPSEITKMTVGVAISACAPVVLAGAAATVARTGHPVSLWWAIAFHVVNDLGFANVLPVGLALYSRAAPKGWGGIMIAVYYLHLFLGNMLMGYIGGLLGTMPATSFWLLHAGLMAISGVILLGARFAFRRALEPTT
jgi:POT family proton-dependent oligopeptide transporter